LLRLTVLSTILTNPGIKQAKIGWLFLKRNPRISLRKPECTSINRINSFNHGAVRIYFDNLELVMEKHMFVESKIFNVDGTGISTVQKPVKRLGPKGRKQVGAAISWERGKNITAVCAVSASGNFVPPMLICPRSRMSPQLQKGGPVGAIYSCSKNGWISEELFFHWLQHFKNCVKPSSDDQVLLILGNHSGHISLRICNYCRYNGIKLVSIPRYTFHRLQPLALTFYGPLKAAFNRECDVYLKRYAHEKITHYGLAERFNKAYLKATSMENGISGYKAAGVFPLNPEKFTETDFQLDEDVITVVSEMAKEESAGGGDQRTHSVAAQVNPQNVIAPEPQPGPSRTVTVPELLPLP
jgi:hypothetical protein